MVTSTTTPLKDHHNHRSQIISIPRKLLPLALYLIIPLALFRFCFYPLIVLDQSPPLFTISSPQDIKKGSFIIESSSPPPSSPKCDYTNGKWVADRQGPMYNSTTCGTIKEGQNCAAHGRPDAAYLYWRWRPHDCQLSRFDPKTFLQILTNKHVAFVGDSMARNQLESLLCMLSTASAPTLVYQHGPENKFRRWNFASHNATVSIYWSPFLVHGVEKSSQGPNKDHNVLHLDAADEKWSNDLREIDYLILSIGHWFLHPGVYLLGDSVLGCHYCPGLNHTEIGFYEPLRKAIRTSLESIRRHNSDDKSNPVKVLVTTFSPSHFEGEWDKAGACPKLRPYEEGEKVLEGMDAEVRQIEVDEVRSFSDRFVGFKVEALDVTKLSLMRPDGHPGPYMNPFPFANNNNNNNDRRVQNDCLHWCLPGPIDTWNEILLQVLLRWDLSPSR